MSFIFSLTFERMCVAICGILAAKISTEETSLLGTSGYKRYLNKSFDPYICQIRIVQYKDRCTPDLGSKPQYMAKLLEIVNQKLQAGEVDVTLKFTLSALWNLTDESPSTCEMFLSVSWLLKRGGCSQERFLW